MVSDLFKLVSNLVQTNNLELARSTINDKVADVYLAEIFKNLCYKL